ncbi:MAG: adenylate cyclase, partial [Bacteroidota bacterium]
MALEIERKFFIPKLPETIEYSPKVAIEQGYLVIAETGDEVRVRRKDDRFTLTVKKGNGLQRQ